MSIANAKEFEYERRFFVDAYDSLANSGFESGVAPQLIIQNYYLSADGYAIRIRTGSMSLNIEMSAEIDPKQIIDEHYDDFNYARMTVKGPGVGGARYEVEQSLDPIIAKEMIKRGGKSIIKNRHSAWIGNDGWVVDVFGGGNYGLIIAECERSTPVIDLEIPPFCTAEITDDKRFSNDELVNMPYSDFADDFLKDLASKHTELLQNVGYDTGKINIQQSLYSSHFGENRFR